MVPVQPYKAPPTVTWEVTRLGSLNCKHWRIEKSKTPDPEQLSSQEGKKLIDQLENMDTKRLVLAGNDPFERQDLVELIKQVKKTDLKLTLQPTATDNLSSKNIQKVANEKFMRFSLYLDAPYPELHDKFWNQKNVFQKTIEMAYKIRQNELPLQINTIITAQSAPLLADMFLKISSLNPVSWKIYFLVPTGQDEPVQPPGFHVTKIIFEEIYS
ncbi:MAG: radical SAM protein, partial [bacterium]